MLFIRLEELLIGFLDVRFLLFPASSSTTYPMNCGKVEALGSPSVSGVVEGKQEMPPI